MARPQQLAQEITKLLQKHHLLSSRQMLEHLGQAGKKYNKTSVYRALETLENDGAICGHDFSGNEMLYELRDHHHDHLVCTHCGTVASAPCAFSTPDKVRGFLVDHHHVTLFGVCQDCQRIKE